MSLFGNLGFTGGANRDAADEAIREGREVQVGPLERFFGATAEDAENIVKGKTQKDLQTRYGPKLAELGLMVDWGESEADVQRKIGTRIQKRVDGQVKKKDAQTKQALQIATLEKDKDRELTKTVEDNKLTSENNRFNATLKSQQEQYAFEGEQRALDRSLDRQLSNNSTDMQMQIAQMNADLADKRMAYDRETKRMDRRDRAIAQLMSGLGQLGGAFSL